MSTPPQHMQADDPALPNGDAKLAAVFRQIRAIQGLDEVGMARLLGTGIDVVLGLEAGSAETLPSWPETARVVERYAALGDVDPAPILSRLLHLQPMPIVPPPRPPAPVSAPEPNYAPLNGLAEALRQAQAPVQSRPAAQAYMTDAPPDALRAPPAVIDLQAETIAPSRQSGPPAAERPTSLTTRRVPPPPEAVSNAAPLPAEAPVAAPIGFAARSRLQGEAATERTRPPTRAEVDPQRSLADIVRRRRRARNTVLVLLPVACLAMMVVGLQVAPRLFYGASDALPGPVGAASRSLIDFMAARTAASKDGLPWIEVPDPRMRKAARLDIR